MFDYGETRNFDKPRSRKHSENFNMSLRQKEKKNFSEYMNSENEGDN